MNMMDQEFSQSIDILFDRCIGGLRSRALLCLLAFFLLAALVFGQTVNGTGLISDASGAIVPGVNVTVRNSETGQVRSTQVRSTKSDSAGIYSIPALPPGPYTYGNGTFGEVTGWGGARSIQFSAKVLW